MDTPRKRLGKYELQERLGQGGVAEVWKAFDPRLQRYVAIKLLHANLRDDPHFLTRFEREAQMIASLHHPNIVQLHAFQVEPGSDASSPIAYMVMDYIEGQTLADYIGQTSSKGQIPPPATILSLFASISMAIDYAHQQGMVHRDIKPANILLDQRNRAHTPIGEPILTDFGIATLLGSSEGTLTSMRFANPLYMSPEQAQGYPGNERSDLYSLGVILYELVTGVPPFRGEDPVAVMRQHIESQPPPPTLINAHIPPALSQVLLRSLAKDPAARFQSGAALTAAFAEALHLPVPEGLGQPVYPPDLEDMPTQLSLPPSAQGTPSAPSAPGSSSSGAIPMPSTPLRKSNQELAASSAGREGVTPVLGPTSGSQPFHTPSPSPARSLPSEQLTPISASKTPLQTPPAALPVTPVPTPSAIPTTRVGQRRWSRRSVALVVLLLVVLIGAGLGGSFVFFRNTPAPGGSVVGHAFFVSSGQLSVGTAQGVADQLRIDLQNIPDPPAGKRYAVWLLGDIHPTVSADLLGPPPISPPILVTDALPVHQGVVHFFYQGDAQHNSLVSAVSRLLITREDVGRTLTRPSPDRSTWLYYAQLPQTPIPLDKQHFSALIHIRHMLYNEEGIKELGLPGGLDIWSLRNTEKVWEWSISARDDWHGQSTSPTQLQLTHDLMIRILDYLDGSSNVHLDAAGEPILTDPTSARVALLTVDPAHQGGSSPQTGGVDYNPVNPRGYVDHNQYHVSQISKAPDVTVEQRQAALRIVTALTNVKTWLLQARKDAVALLKMNSDQLKQPQAGSILNDLVTQATAAYIGQLDPATQQVQPGVLQAHEAVGQLATLTITTDLPQRL